MSRWAVRAVATPVFSPACDEEDPLLQEPREDIERAFPAAGLLDHHGNEGGVSFDRIERHQKPFKGRRGIVIPVSLSYLTPRRGPQALQAACRRAFTLPKALRP